jgi:hypothetical protein
MCGGGTRRVWVVAYLAPSGCVDGMVLQAGDVSVQNATFAFNYELDKGEKELGSGQFSVVRRARRKRDGLLVAVKCIEKASLTEEDLQVRARARRTRACVRAYVFSCLEHAPARPRAVYADLCACAARLVSCDDDMLAPSPPVRVAVRARWARTLARVARPRAQPY